MSVTPPIVYAALAAEDLVLDAFFVVFADFFVAFLVALALFESKLNPKESLPLENFIVNFMSFKIFEMYKYYFISICIIATNICDNKKLSANVQF